MSKAKNPTIGTIACTCCGLTADIRKVEKSSTLYVHCSHGCGTDVRKGQKFQDHIAGKGTFFPGMVPENIQPDMRSALDDDAGEDITAPGNNPARENEQPAKNVDGDNAGSWLY